MWHLIKEDGFVFAGTRQEIIEFLDIKTIYFEDRDELELVDISRPSHWAKICECYGISGFDSDDTDQNINLSGDDSETSD